MTNKLTKGQEKFKVIRCSRCGISSPYGSAHICNEYDVAYHNSRMPLGRRIIKWFNTGMRSN